MKLLEKLFGAGRCKSVWAARFDCGGCNGCAVESLAALSPVFGGERFGAVETHDPRLADVLLVTGAPGPQTRENLRAAFDLMLSPKAVVAVGDCALGEGPWSRGEAERSGAQAAVSVQVRVPGCPPRPEAVLQGVLQALKILESRRQETP